MLKMTSVINLKGKKNIWEPSLEQAPPDIVYIGRNMFMGGGGWKLKNSIFANPFRIGPNETREDVYKRYIMQKPDLLKQRPELKEKTLACWCSPQACHGDVLVQLINDL